MSDILFVLAAGAALGLLWNISRRLDDIVRMMRERGGSGSAGI